MKNILYWFSTNVCYFINYTSFYIIYLYLCTFLAQSVSRKMWKLFIYGKCIFYSSKWKSYSCSQRYGAFSNFISFLVCCKVLDSLKNVHFYTSFGEFLCTMRFSFFCFYGRMLVWITMVWTILIVVLVVFVNVLYRERNGN